MGTPNVKIVKIMNSTQIALGLVAILALFAAASANDDIFEEPVPEELLETSPKKVAPQAPPGVKGPGGKPDPETYFSKSTLLQTTYRPNCGSGYTNGCGGSAKYWSCGRNCARGKYFTKGDCSCCCTRGGSSGGGGSTPAACTDTHSSCASWKSGGYCNHHYVKPRCKKTCNFCAGGSSGSRRRQPTTNYRRRQPTSYRRRSGRCPHGVRAVSGHCGYCHCDQNMSYCGNSVCKVSFSGSGHRFNVHYTGNMCVSNNKCSIDYWCKTAWYNSALKNCRAGKSDCQKWKDRCLKEAKNCSTMKKHEYDCYRL